VSAATLTCGLNSHTFLSGNWTLPSMSLEIGADAGRRSTRCVTIRKPLLNAALRCAVEEIIRQCDCLRQDRLQCVAAINYGNGVASAHLMAKALGPDGGDIGLVFHAADFFVTKQRYDTFKATIASDYPNIKIVDEQGIGGPDFSGDAE
jgi:hypothetical protein